jgi:uncharacterized protein YndB with AHSA1/START domain
MNITNVTKDVPNKQIIIDRAINADGKGVWNAWTTKELLEQWWAPKPWNAVTKAFVFSEGGQWLYAMSGPEGEKVWALFQYSNIETEKHFSAVDAFCDEDGKINTILPGAVWHIEFVDEGAKTTLHVTIQYKTEEALHKTIEMGFEQGFSMALDNLEELLTRST